MVAMNRFGTLLRQKRAALGISLRELARRTKVHPSHISRLELGKNANPGIVTLMHISDALDISVGELAELAATSLRAGRDLADSHRAKRGGSRRQKKAR